MEITDHLTCLLRNLYVGQEATFRTRYGMTYSKLGKEYVKAVYCHPAYLTYMQIFAVVQLPSSVQLFATPWTTACQTSPFLAISWSLPKFMSIELVMWSNNLILYHSLILLLSNFPSFRVFSNDRLVPSGGQSSGASALVLPKSIQVWFPLRLIGLISLHPKGLLRVFSSTTDWKHKFFGALLSLLFSSHIRTWLSERP